MVLIAEEREAVLNGIRGLPPELRNAQLAKLLGRSVHDPKLAREFRANPRESFEMYGVHIPDGLVVEVHYQTPKSLHVTLPSAELASQQRGGGPLEITDADLVTAVETLSFLGVCPRMRSWRRKPPRNNLLTVIWTLSWSN